MWVINKEKEHAKSCLISEITGNITNLTSNSKEIEDLISSINCTIEGVSSGTDIRWIGSCQRVLNNLSQAMELLHKALENAKKLNIMRWVGNGYKYTAYTE